MLKQDYPFDGSTQVTSEGLSAPPDLPGAQVASFSVASWDSRAYLLQHICVELRDAPISFNRSRDE
jgi:hypothetical protein